MVESPPVFYFDGVMNEKADCEIAGDEVRHIFQSRRLGPGDAIALTDGRGLYASGLIKSADKKQQSLIVRISRTEEIEPSKVKKILAAAIPKGDRQSVLLNMSTQLGMDEYIPMECEYSVVTYQTRMQERWNRLVVGACKQSQQCHFPLISQSMRFAELVASGSNQRLVIVGDMGGESISSVNNSLTNDIIEVLMLVGPEGGFNDREIELLNQQNILKLRLSNQILRTETAAVSLLATVNQLI